MSRRPSRQPRRLLRLLLPALALAACTAEDLAGPCLPESCPTGYACAADGDGCVPVAVGDDRGGLVGAWVSVAVRPGGQPVVAAYDATYQALAVGWRRDDGSFRYHFPDGAGAPPAAVPPAGRDIGQHASVAVGADGLPRVAYYDRSQGDLRFARFDGGAWRVEVVDGAAGDVGRDASLALDAADRPHIAYYDATERVLRYAARAELGWTTEPVPLAFTMGSPPPPDDPDYGRFASLQLSLGAPVVAFYEARGGDLLLATRAVDGWRTIVLDGRDATGADTGDVGAFASLAVDTRGDVSVAYYDATRGVLRYAEGAAGVVKSTVVDDGTDAAGCERHLVGQRASLAVDAAGRPRIAYFDATALALRFARRGSDGVWTRAVLDAEPGAGLWLDHALAGDVSFVAYATVDLDGPLPLALRVREVGP